MSRAWPRPCFRIGDPAQLLAQHEGKTSGAGLLLGIGSAGHVFRMLPLVSNDASGRNHQIVIPFNTPVKLVLRSSFCRFADSVGLAPATTVATVVPINVATGQTVAPIMFTVRSAGN